LTKTYTAENPLRILSLGWGVQSWTLAAMAALGDIPPVDYAIHADTTHEAEGTYKHAAKYTPWLEERGVKVRTVVAPTTSAVRPYSKTKAILIPAFTENPAGQQGQIRRQCTSHWKIQPIRRLIREIVGSKSRPRMVTSLQGISLDEFQRMRTSDVKYIENQYPLVDLRITRADCNAWLQDHGLDVPPKSACVFCPYHNKTAWQGLKKRGGSDWDHAVEVDEAIRDKRSLDGQDFLLYVHPHRKPLSEAISIPEDFGAEQIEFEMPCDSGHCFV
jgi:hypothetical protein